MLTDKQIEERCRRTLKKHGLNVRRKDDAYYVYGPTDAEEPDEYAHFFDLMELNDYCGELDEEAESIES